MLLYEVSPLLLPSLPTHMSRVVGAVTAVGLSFGLRPTCERENVRSCQNLADAINTMARCLHMYAACCINLGINKASADVQSTFCLLLDIGIMLSYCCCATAAVLLEQVCTPAVQVLTICTSSSSGPAGNFQRHTPCAASGSRHCQRWLRRMQPAGATIQTCIR